MPLLYIYVATSCNFNKIQHSPFKEPRPMSESHYWLSNCQGRYYSDGSAVSQ